MGTYTDGWVVDYANQRCGEESGATCALFCVLRIKQNFTCSPAQDCDPSLGAPCAAHEAESEQIFASAEQCCNEKLPWESDCVDNS